MITGLPGYKINPRNNGIVLDVSVIKCSPSVRVAGFARVAKVMSHTGEIMTWPLDSNYEIKVINELND